MKELVCIPTGPEVLKRLFVKLRLGMVGVGGATPPTAVGEVNDPAVSFALSGVTGVIELEPVPVTVPLGAVAAPVPVAVFPTDEVGAGPDTAGAPTPCS